MKALIVCILLLVMSAMLNGQDFKDELKVGDKLPMTELKNMVNYPSKTLKFSDHKPKLTILDFWGTGCGGCVVAWPRMLALQKEFGNDLQIILVNRFEDEKTNRDYFAARKKLVGVDMNLPASCKDTTLRKYFPRRTVPRYYWIDSNGVLSSVTHGEQVSSRNIRRWIEKGPFEMEQIVEELHSYDGNKPLFVDGNGGTGRVNDFLWSSSLSRAQLNLVGSMRSSTSPITGYSICGTGLHIDALYRIAYNNRLAPDQPLSYMPMSRRELLASDTGKFVGRIDGERSVKARYNYQLIVNHPMDRDQLQVLMQEDLKKWFGLTATWEKKKKLCLVFSMFDSIKATEKTFGDEGLFVGETQTTLDNVRMRDVIYYMELGSFFSDTRPIVDETDFRGLLKGIHFDAYYKDIKALDRGFSRFGIHLKEEFREVDILVLKEPAKPN